MQNKNMAPRPLRQRRLLAPAAAARPLGARAARSRAAARVRSPRPPPPSHGALHPPGSESPHDHPPPPRPGLRCTRHPRLRRWQRQRVMACWAYAGDNDGRHTYYAARVITGFCCRSVPWPGPAAGRAHARHHGEYRYRIHYRHFASSFCWFLRESRQFQNQFATIPFLHARTAAAQRQRHGMPGPDVRVRFHATW